MSAPHIIVTDAPTHAPHPLPIPPDMAAWRAATRECSRANRLRLAVDALWNAGLGRHAEVLKGAADMGSGFADAMTNARDGVAGLLVRLGDGHDPARYDAAVTAQDALGALWCVS